MSDEQIKGSCFCGAVEFEVNGEPTVMVYCHCKDCQAWSAGPINSASLWNPDLLDRKSTRLNSSHKPISYAVFCLKKKTYIPYILYATHL